MTLEYFGPFMSKSYMAYGKHRRKYSRVIGDQIHEFKFSLRFSVDYVATVPEKKKLDKITAKKWPLNIDSL